MRLALTQPALSMLAAPQICVLWRELVSLLAVRLLHERLTLLAHHVQTVVTLCAEPQVIDVYAARIVTGMANMLAVRNRALLENPHETVDADGFTFEVSVHMSATVSRWRTIDEAASLVAD